MIEKFIKFNHLEQHILRSALHTCVLQEDVRLHCQWNLIRLCGLTRMNGHTPASDIFQIRYHALSTQRTFVVSTRQSLEASLVKVMATRQHLEFTHWTVFQANRAVQLFGLFDMNLAISRVVHNELSPIAA